MKPPKLNKQTNNLKLLVGAMLVVMLLSVGCKTSSPKPKAPIVPLMLIPQAVHKASVSTTQQAPQTNSVIAGGIVGYVETPDGGYRSYVSQPFGINYTNTFPDMQEGDWGISGITWGNGYDSPVVVWVHIALYPSLMSQAYQWVLWETTDPSLPFEDWIPIDKEDSFGSQDIRFYGGKWNPNGVYYKATRIVL